MFILFSFPDHYFFLSHCRRGRLLNNFHFKIIIIPEIVRMWDELFGAYRDFFLMSDWWNFQRESFNTSSNTLGFSQNASAFKCHSYFTHLIQLIVMILRNDRVYQCWSRSICLWYTLKVGLRSRDITMLSASFTAIFG